MLKISKLLYLLLISCFFSLFSAAAAETADAVVEQTVDKHLDKAANQAVNQAVNQSADETTVATTSADEDNTEKTDNSEAAGIKLTVAINGIEDDKLRDNAEAFLAIYAEKDKVVKNPSYINYLAKSGVAQIKQSLQPFGYYSAEVTMQNEQQAELWQVTYQVTLGEPVIVEHVDVVIDGEGRQNPDYQSLLASYPLKVGDILVQEKYKTFKGDLQALATTDGYFDAQFTRRKIAIHDGYQGADIAVTYDTGARYHFGKTTITQDFLDDDVFQRFITYQDGDVYSSTAIADIQRDLYNSNYVKMVDVTAEPQKADKTVPVEFALTPKANKKHTFSVGYGTDSGARAKYDFDWRWVNRRGHRFKSSIYVAEEVQEIGAEYRIPAQRPATDYYKIFADVKRDYSGDVESLMWNLGGAYHDQVGNWEREIGIKWQQEDFTLGNDSGNIGLLTPFASLTYRKVDDPLNISRGLLLHTELAGGHESLLSDVSFLQAVANAKAIRKFGDKHKVKLAGGIGKTWVSDFHELPAAYRFFTGGDRSIRGYSFHSIGDTDSSGSNIGGDKMYYISAEYEYFLNDKMALATFVDAGDAFSDDAAKLKVGAGVGFHYYSPIGPIRIDVAHGFDEPGDDVRLHLNIGPEM